MNRKTLKALQGSIKKWEAIVDGTGEDFGQINCTLCHEFYRCRNGCPVYKRTRVSRCESTPYEKWAAHRYGEHSYSGGAVECVDCLTYALNELYFLKSLLPGRLGE